VSEHPDTTLATEAFYPALAASMTMAVLGVSVCVIAVLQARRPDVMTVGVARPSTAEYVPPAELRETVRQIELEYERLRELLPDAPPLKFERYTPGMYSRSANTIALDPMYYTDAPAGHIRFVLAHELGHWAHVTFAPEDYDHASREQDQLGVRRYYTRAQRRADRIQSFADEFAQTFMPPDFDRWDVLERLADVELVSFWTGAQQ
jgi:hypothetical protein